MPFILHAIVSLMKENEDDYTRAKKFPALIFAIIIVGVHKCMCYYLLIVVITNIVVS